MARAGAIAAVVLLLALVASAEAVRPLPRRLQQFVGVSPYGTAVSLPWARVFSGRNTGTSVQVPGILNLNTSPYFGTSLWTPWTRLTGLGRRRA